MFVLCILQEIQRAKSLKGRITTQLMAPIQRITGYPMLLGEICELYDSAENDADTVGISLTKEQTRTQKYCYEALGLSRALVDYTNKMLIANRITGYAVSSTS